MLTDGCILTLDVGGTYIKHALMMGAGEPAGYPGQTPTGSGGSAGEALAALAGVASAARLKARECGLRIDGLAIAFPGPFKYDHGVPMMRHKFQALYGISITPALLEALPGVPIVYMHDSTAFLLGEAAYGAAKGATSPAGVMLGTGLGFACMAEGRVRVSPDQRPAVRVWNRPFREGIAEDALSARGIAARYAARTGTERDAKEIAARAREGESTALAVYRETGVMLGEIIGPVLRGLGSDRLVVGGQVARSAELFLPYTGLDVPVVCADSLDAAALKGAYAYFRLGRERAVEVVGDDLKKVTIQV